MCLALSLFNISRCEECPLVDKTYDGECGVIPTTGEVLLGMDDTDVIARRIQDLELVLKT